ncbi:hypothetical protein OEA41_004132 [Lepraria neglecta]|uniref:MFS general substrate transporter n=1 Tax=Lepraria neglecta TaxID=209136 RepID=A0AAE0DM39_9LECA|nr:hypothetical protein OEA41_004132 [Lepraria neglecta]
MASLESEKQGPTAQDKTDENSQAEQHSPSTEQNITAVYPTGWKYRTHRLGPWTIPCYASPPVQLVLVAFVCFFCPGMFNALNGLGGGGQFNATTADNSNVAVYSTFSVLGFFAGSITNRLGIKLTLSLGGLGYCLYVSSYLSYNHNQNSGFVIFAGAMLGVCAGMLWAAQGAIMMSYPQEKSKGRYISWFWMIFNLGGVIGSLIPLGENIHSNAGNVSDGTYIGFMVLTFLGACLALTLVDAHDVVRSDGSHVILMKHPSWRSEFLGLWEVLQTDIWIVFLFPMFIASNWFYSYQFNGFNGAKFNIRTRALNNVLYWTSQIIGAYVFGYMLDIRSLGRTMRAKLAWGMMFLLTMVVWGGGYAWQKGYTRAETSLKTYVKDDWTTHGYVGPMFLYMFYGFYDAAWQTCVYWFMGALTNNGRKLANFAGFYKGIQSAGSAITFRIDALGVPFMNEFASSWALLAGSLLIAAPLIFTKIRDTVPIDEDLVFTDETYEDVKPMIAKPPEVREKV